MCPVDQLQTVCGLDYAQRSVSHVIWRPTQHTTSYFKSRSWMGSTCLVPLPCSTTSKNPCSTSSQGTTWNCKPVLRRPAGRAKGSQKGGYRDNIHQSSLNDVICWARQVKAGLTPSWGFQILLPFFVSPIRRPRRKIHTLLLSEWFIDLWIQWNVHQLN